MRSQVLLREGRSQHAVHRGPDRRHLAAHLEASSTRPLVLSAVALAVLWLVASIPAFVPSFDQPALDTAMMRVSLEAIGAALALVGSVLLYLRWRMTGEATALWLATALLVYGTVTSLIAGALPEMQPDLAGADVVMWLGAASRVGVIGLFAAAFFSPPVNSRVRPWLLLAGALGAIALLTVTFQLLPAIGQFGAGASDLPGRDVSGPLVVAFAWTALGTMSLVLYRRRKRAMFGWFGLLLFTFAAAELHLLVADTGLAMAGGELLRAAALLCGLGGGLIEFQRAFAAQSSQLRDSTVSRLAAEARLQAQALSQRERAHEAVNALAAIEGASVTLERFHDRLDPDVRNQLSAGISVEVARLQRIVQPETAEPVKAFWVHEVIAPVITSAMERGAVIASMVPGDLAAMGRWGDTAVALEHLIDLAWGGNGKGPVRIFAEADGERALIRISGTAETSSTALDSHVSTRLLRGQEGDVWVEEREGNSVYVIALPGAEGPGPTATP